MTHPVTEQLLENNARYARGEDVHARIVAALEGAVA